MVLIVLMVVSIPPLIVAGAFVWRVQGYGEGDQ